MNTPSILTKTAQLSARQISLPIRYLLQATGWLPLRSLPSHEFASIRAMGDMLFSALTKTPLGQIEVLPVSSTLVRQKQEVQNAALVVSQVAPENVLQIACDALPALGGKPYRAQAILLCLPEHTYMLVEDFAGKYLYRWPASDNLGSAKNGYQIAENDVPSPAGCTFWLVD